MDTLSQTSSIASQFSEVRFSSVAVSIYTKEKGINHHTTQWQQGNRSIMLYLLTSSSKIFGFENIVQVVIIEKKEMEKKGRTENLGCVE